MSTSLRALNSQERGKTSIIITGAAGFIGSHLVDRFLEEGFRVVGIDNFLTGRPENIASQEKNSRFHFLKHDLTEPLDLPEKFAPVGALLHFASPASPIDYLEFPIETLKVGSYGTHHVLGIARRWQAPFLLASTSEVYGDPLVHPQPESYWGNVNPIGPRSVYDEAKRFSEALTMAYHRKHGLDTKIVRIFNTYGPRMRTEDGRAVPNFFCQALLKKELTVYGDGSQTRSFCFVSDLVEGIYRLLMSEIHEPVNLGNPHEMTILALAQEINRRAGNSSPIVYRELPANDPKVRKPDITRARTELKWEPRVSFEQGIQMTLDYFRNLLSTAR